MHISLSESNKNGFNKWCAAHDGGCQDDGRPGVGGAIVIAGQDLDQAVMAPPEQPHRPWLVPGAGTL